MPNNILSVWPHLVLQLLHELPSFTSTDINCWITSKILTTIRYNASNTERKCWNSASFSVSLQNTRFLDLFFKLLYAYSFACVLSCFSPVCATPWTVAHQASLSMGFSRQEYWSGLSCPPPGDPPNPEIKPVSLTSPELAGGFFTTSTTWEAPNWFYRTNIFSVVMYGCESCTKKKAECWRIDALELWCLRRLLKFLGLQDQPVNPKGNQSWLFIGRTDAEAEATILWSPGVKNWLIGKDPDNREDWRQEEKGRQRMKWLHGLTNSMDMSWESFRSWWWTGRPGMLQSMGLQRVGHDWATERNWTEYIFFQGGGTLKSGRNGKASNRGKLLEYCEIINHILLLSELHSFINIWVKQLFFHVFLARFTSCIGFVSFFPYFGL